MEKYRIDTNAGVVYIGYIHSAHELEDALTAIVSDPAYKPGMGMRGDRRRMVANTTSEIKLYLEIVRGFRKAMGDCAWAVVTDDMANFGMIRMGSTLASFVGIKAEVFKSEAEFKKKRSVKQLGLCVCRGTHRPSSQLTRLL